MDTIADQTLYGVCIKRQQILMVWSDVEKQFCLPFVCGEGQLSEKLAGFFHTELKTEIVFPLEVHKMRAGFSWTPIVFQKPPEVKKQLEFSKVFYHLEKVWISLSEAQENELLPLHENARALLKAFSKDAGNSYIPITTYQGVPTFMHLQTGEILHSQEGPEEEAEKLYVAPLGLRKAEGNKVLFDCGLGCGTLVLKAFSAFEQNSLLQGLTVLSFDLEKAGLLALAKSSQFQTLSENERIVLQKMSESNEFEHKLPSGRTFQWKFVPGNFVSCIEPNQMVEMPKADFVCYDFFSPKSHPSLWEIETLKNLRLACTDNCILSTYCSATAVRSHFLQAGFFVGEGIASGKKTSTTVAATNFDLLQKPLSSKFLALYELSQAPFLESQKKTKENHASSQKNVLENLKLHSQWHRTPTHLMNSFLGVLIFISCFFSIGISSKIFASEEKKIVTSILPLQQITKELFCNSPHFKIELMDSSPPNLHAHDFAWTPRSKQQIAKADFFIAVSPSLELWLLDSNLQTLNKNFHTLNKETDKISASQLHFWNSPAESVQSMQKLELFFSEKFPAERENFRSCLQAFSGKASAFLASAKNDVQKILTMRKTNFLSVLMSHDTHKDYFESLGLRVETLPLQLAALERLGPKDLNQVIQFAQEKKIDLVFYDEHFPKQIACKLVNNDKSKCQGPFSSDAFPKSKGLLPFWTDVLKQVTLAISSTRKG